MSPVMMAEVEAIRQFVGSAQFVETVEKVLAHKAQPGQRPQPGQGRLPGWYQVTVPGKALRGVSDTVRTVYQTLGASKVPMTVKALEAALAMPHSTVWYALTKLKARKLISVEYPEA